MSLNQGLIQGMDGALIVFRWTSVAGREAVGLFPSGLPRNGVSGKEPAVVEPYLAVSGVGSLPHRSAEQAVADVLAFCPEYPYWPQLPRRDRREDMYRQFSAGLPGLVEKPGGGYGWRRDEAALQRLEQVYADALALEAGSDPTDAWAVDRADAEGLYAFADALAAALAAGGPRAAGDGVAARPVPCENVAPQPVPAPVPKGQTTGPISLGLAVTDAAGRPLLYEEDLMDGVVRGLALRARWQQRFLARAAGGGPVLLCVDEPYLGTFGSAYFPYRQETVSAYLDVFDKTLGGIWGIHCCANTDWEFILASPVRFISFDAYEYGERLVLYPAAVKAFLAEGKTLHWGIVPTAPDRLAAESAETLSRRLLGLFETLVARGVPERALASQSMITPACGLSGLEVEQAGRAMLLAREVSDKVRVALGAGAEPGPEAGPKPGPVE